MTDYEQMRELDKRVAIEVMGWKWVTPSYTCQDEHRRRWLVSPEQAGFQWNLSAPSHLLIDTASLEKNVPRYCADISVAFEMESEIERQGLAKDYTKAIWNSSDEMFDMVHASPLQRVRAALAVAGKGTVTK